MDWAAGIPCGIGPPAFPSGLGLRHSLSPRRRGPCRAGCYANGMFYSRLEQFSHTAQMPAASIAFSVYHIARARILGIGPPAFPYSSPEGPLQKTDLELRSIFYAKNPLLEQALRGFFTQKNRMIFIIRPVFCGERGIRTPEPVKVNGFQDRRIRPLCHLSNSLLGLQK